MKSRTIYLVRHTKPDVPQGVCYGQSDIGVARSFSAESRTTFEKLCALEGAQNLDALHIVSSPLQRCLLLAEVLRGAQNLETMPIPTDDRLKEMNFGAWEMRRWRDIDEFVMNAWMRDYVNTRATDGESFREVVERTVAAFHDHAKYSFSATASIDAPLVIVAHSGVIRAMLAHHLEMPLHKAFSLEIDYGSISAIAAKPHYSSVLFVNR